MTRWYTIGPFKSGRACFVLLHIVWFPNILFVDYYTNKGVQLAQWMVRWLATIGTWVRFPGPPKTFISFLNMIICRLPREFHHVLQTSACHVSWSSNPMARMKGPSYISVNHAHVTIKSQPGQASVGQNCLENTSKRVNKPPMFAFLFSIFFFSIIYFKLYYLFCLIPN